MKSHNDDSDDSSDSPKSRKRKLVREDSSSSDSDSSSEASEDGDMDDVPLEAYRTEEAKQQLLEAAIRTGKKKFEKESHDMLASIPESYKAKFGCLAFARWAGKQLPVLVLNPYHVPPNPVRSQWLTQVHNLKKQRRLHDLTYIIYWYGTGGSDSCYSFTKSLIFVDSEKGQALRSTLDQKITGEIKTTPKDNEVLRCYREMLEDVDKEPEERKRGVKHWEENYQCLTYDDIATLSASPAKKTAKDKKKKKVTATKKKNKRPRKDEDEDEKPKKKKPLKVSKKPVERPATPSEEESEEEHYMGESAESSEYDASSSPSPQKAKKTKEKKQDKASPVKKKNSEENKPQTPPREPKANKPLSKKQKRKNARVEKELLVQCEEKYGSFLVKWQNAIKKGDTKKIAGVLVKLDRLVDSFCASFTKCYGIPQLLKDTKTLLKTSGADLTQYKTVWSKLKSSYVTKLEQLPADFTITPSSRAIGMNSDNHAAQKPQSEELQGKMERTVEEEAPAPSSVVLIEKSSENPTSTDLVHRSQSPETVKRPVEQNKSITDDQSSPTGLPAWMVESFDWKEIDESPRRMGREFLFDMSSELPQQILGSVNLKQMAYAIEQAVYQSVCSDSSTSKELWVPIYWKKIDAIISGVCGNLSPGALMDHLVKGNFRSPNDLVNLNNSQFIDSFEGRTVVL